MVSGGVTTFRADRAWDRKRVCVCYSVFACQGVSTRSRPIGSESRIGVEKDCTSTNQPTNQPRLSSSQRSRRRSATEDHRTTSAGATPPLLTEHDKTVTLNAQTVAVDVQTVDSQTVDSQTVTLNTQTVAVNAQTVDSQTVISQTVTLNAQTADSQTKQS